MHTRLAAIASAAMAISAHAQTWQQLFDGRSLQGWHETPFERHGAVRVDKGAILLDAGYMTGIQWTGSFPRSNYEIRLEAMRVEGHDFFAGITFPVGESFCTWINGGWGGKLVGLSSLDGLDAASKETAKVVQFEQSRWYALRLRVTDDSITAWIDDRMVIDVGIEGRVIGLRPGPIELSKPLGSLLTKPRRSCASSSTGFCPRAETHSGNARSQNSPIAETSAPR